MKKFDCPHCKCATLSVWDKYLAAKWKIINCSHCGARVCSAPLFLAAFYLLYLADVIDFTYLSVLLDSNVWLIVAIAGWIVLDAFSLYLPLKVIGMARSRDAKDVTEAFSLVDDCRVK